MKKLMLLLALVMSFSFVAATDCYGMDAQCPEGTEVHCWEDATSYNWDCTPITVQQYSALPDGSEWCDSDQVIDYDKKICCSINFPYLQDNKCNMFPQKDSHNYFTEHFICEPYSIYCVGQEEGICTNSENKDSPDPFIRETFKWEGIGLEYGRCGYEECYEGDTKCEGANYYTCNDNKWQNWGPKIDRCKVECLETTDCNEKREVASFCINGAEEIQYYIETCENYQCIPDVEIVSTKVIGVCDVECLSNNDCEDERITGKYWEDKELYYDIVTQECDNNVCSDIREPVKLNSTFVTYDLDIDEYGKSIFSIIVNRVLNWFRRLF